MHRQRSPRRHRSPRCPRLAGREARRHLRPLAPRLAPILFTNRPNPRANRGRAGAPGRRRFATRRSRRCIRRPEVPPCRELMARTRCRGRSRLFPWPGTGPSAGPSRPAPTPGLHARLAR
jgi:hypothetical protein